MGFSIKRVIRNLHIDIKYAGRFLGGSIDTRYADLGAYHTVNTDYALLDRVMPQIIEPDDVIIDVGCGKGRVIAWCLSQQLSNLIIGVELDPDLARDAGRRFKKYKNVQIISGNILESFPANGTLFYLYNPFNEVVLQKFTDLILNNLNPKRLTKIVYHNPEYLHLFRENKLFDIEVLAVSENGHETAIIRVNG